ncbi:MAG TPA: YceI family protein [Vicinamibacteria bacterium]|nr:YceI family protein [Vicinamibacteria bacterium]
MLALAVAAALPVAGSAAEMPAYRVVRGEVRVLCPVTVGGSFEAVTTSLSGTLGIAALRPAVLRGDLTVDLSSLDTGIALRNAHLRDKYLEVDKGGDFATAVLSDVRLDKVEASTFKGRTPFTGMLRLHGTRRPVSGRADIRFEGADVRVAASFPVRIDDYGIAPPRYLGVGVKNEVQVKVSLLVTPVPALGGGQ